MGYSKKGKIIDVERDYDFNKYIKQGIKGNKQSLYKNFPGSNGTYLIGSDYNGPVLLIT